jgi:hypothetical protein
VTARSAAGESAGRIRRDSTKATTTIGTLQLRGVEEFRATVLADPGAAMAWWFMRNPEKFDSTTLNDITKLIEYVQRHGRDRVAYRVAEIILGVMADLKGHERLSAITMVNTLLTNFGSKAAVAEVEDLLRADTPQPDPGCHGAERSR